MLRIFASTFVMVAAAATATVNVNIAQQSELQSVRGLDKYKAKQIIEHRYRNGPYRTLDDLAEVIGADAAESVATQVAFTGDAYVPPPQPEKKAAKKK